MNLPRLSDGCVLGLPLRTAALYGFAFSAAFLLYCRLWPQAPLFAPDTAGYLSFAQDLADGSDAAPRYRAPAYPTLLWLTGSVTNPSRFLFHVSLLLHFGSVWLLAVILREMGCGKRALGLFGLVLLCPLFVQTAGWALTENLTQFFLIGGLLSFSGSLRRSSAWQMWASGVIFACAALTRPAYQLIVLPLVIVVLIHAALSRQRFAQRLPRFMTRGTLVAFFFPLLAYGSLNYLQFGFFGITYSLGHNLSTRTARFIHLLPDEYQDVRTILIEKRDERLLRNPEPGSHSVHWYDNHARQALQAKTGLSGVSLANYMLRLNLALILRHPVAYAREVSESFVGYLFPYMTQLAAIGPLPVRLSLYALHVLLLAAFLTQFVVLVGQVTYGWFQTIGKHRTDAGLQAPFDAPQIATYAAALSIIVYTGLVSCLLDTGEPRQRTPTDPLIVFVTVLGWYLVMEQSQTPAIGAGKNSDRNQSQPCRSLHS